MTEQRDAPLQLTPEDLQAFDDMWQAGVRSRDLIAHYRRSLSVLGELARQRGLPERWPGWVGGLTLAEWREALQMDRPDDPHPEAVLGRAMTRHALLERPQREARLARMDRAERHYAMMPHRIIRPRKRQT